MDNFYYLWNYCCSKDGLQEQKLEWHGYVGGGLDVTINGVFISKIQDLDNMIMSQPYLH